MSSRFARRLNLRRRKLVPRIDSLEERMMLTLGVYAISAIEGTPFNKPIATFLESDLPTVPTANYTASIDWGDGKGPTSATPVLTDAAQKIYTVYGTKTYSDDGAYTITVSVGGTGSAVSATATGPATISAIPINTNPASVNVFIGQPIPGGTLLATFTDNYAGLTPASYRADINWGDGNTSVGTITQDSATKVFSVAVPSGDSHRFTQTGSPPVVVTVTRLVDSNFQQVSPTVKVVASPIVLTAAPGTVSVFVGQAVSGGTLLATYTDAYPGLTAANYKADIAWGDGTSSTGTITQDVATKVYSVAVPSGDTHQFNQAGSPAVVVTVTRLVDSASQQVSPTVKVVASPIVLTAAPGTVSVFVGQAFAGGTLLATYTDAYPGLTPANYKADIAWGDGTTSTGTITQDSATKVYSVAVPSGDTHHFNQAGTPAVVVTVTRLVDSVSQQVKPSVQIFSRAVVFRPVVLSGRLGTSVSGVVAHFTDPYSAATDSAANYLATIGWGDGTTTSGAVAAVPGVTGFFQISGSKTYSNLGTYPLTISLTRVTTGETFTLSANSAGGGSSVVVTPSARLESGAGNGSTALVTVTANNRPTFVGTAGPFTAVRLTAIGSGFLGNTILGQTTAGSDGTWRLSTGPLPDGVYQVTATFVASTDKGVSSVNQVSLPVEGGAIRIDTQAPTVIGVRYVKAVRQIVLETTDVGSGLDLAALGDINNFSVVPVHLVGGVNISRVPIVAINTVTNDPRSVTTRITLGKKINPKAYRLLIASLQIRDGAGNSLAFPLRGVPIPSITAMMKAKHRA